MFSKRWMLCAGVVGLLVPVSAAGADETGPAPSLKARAVADGMRFGFGMPKFLIVEQFADWGGPVAEAATDELDNHGFASLPYPGDNGIGGPSTVAGVAGLPSPPSYPFYAASSYPSQPEASWGQEGWKLSAKSDDASTTALAQSGYASSQAAVFASSATARTRRDADTGGVEAEAASRVDGFRIGDVLAIAHVVSSARSSRPGGGESTRSSNFVVEGVSIGGQAVGFGPAGFVLAGQKTPLPDGSPLLAALRGQGITLTYLAPVDAPDGITSAGLSVTQSVKLPSGHVMRTTYVLGRSLAETFSLSTGERAA
jgi:hypothetical protein